MNGRFQMQGGKNWILPKEMNANRFFWDFHWLEIWSVKSLLSLYGTEWRERGYGLSRKVWNGIGLTCWLDKCICSYYSTNRKRKIQGKVGEG